MSVVIPLMLQNPYFITSITSGISLFGYGVNKYLNTEDKISNIYKETSDYEIADNFINIVNTHIPNPPKLPNNLFKGDTTLKIKIKTRYDNFEHYKKCLRNKRKRQRQKINKRKNIKNK
tara:strand:- start:223 stop:579 length:357 start_codon:yes stop_codon:yes gene_type:complete